MQSCKERSQDTSHVWLITWKFDFTSVVHLYNDYKDIWKPLNEEKLVAKWEINNPMDEHIIQEVKSN